MSFFEPPPPRPDPPREPRQLAWMGPPRNVVGGVVALELLVARSDRAIVWLGSASAYPTGVEFRLDVRWRPDMHELALGPGPPFHYESYRGGELPDELFRSGFEFADGSKVTTLGHGSGAPPFAARPDAEPDQPVLMPRGGSGGPDGWSQALWLWPLPSEKPLTLVCEWPALGIELSRAEIDLPALRAAAARSRALWTVD
jgi:hypothetical protein